MSEVLIDLIRPSPYQPRLRFDVEDLKQEIQRDGLLSPLIVRRCDGFYEIIDGERRWRALKELGWKTVEVEIRDVDDRRARLTVYKLNKIRESYTVEEEARYFKKLADGGMPAYQIGKELNVDDSWVRAHLNIFRFSEDIQRAVWGGQLSVGHIRDIEAVIGANIEEATKIAREIILRRLSREETRKLVQPRIEEIEKARIKAAEEAIGARAPIEVKLETPEELEKAAEALKKEAMRKREEALTPEEKVEKKRMEEEKRRKREEARKRREEEERRRIEEEAKRRAKELEEAERRRIEEETLRKAEDKLLKDRRFLQKAKEEFLKMEPLIPIREAKEELAVKEGIIYTIGELDCDRCGRHYVIKCDGKRNWLE